MFRHRFLADHRPPPLRAPPAGQNRSTCQSRSPPVKCAPPAPGRAPCKLGNPLIDESITTVKDRRQIPPLPGCDHSCPLSPHHSLAYLRPGYRQFHSPELGSLGMAQTPNEDLWSAPGHPTLPAKPRRALPAAAHHSSAPCSVMAHRRTGQIWCSLAKRTAQKEQAGLVRTTLPHWLSGPGAGSSASRPDDKLPNQGHWPSATAGMLRGRPLLLQHPAVALQGIKRYVGQHATLQ
jgi:hypothetical protein